MIRNYCTKIPINNIESKTDRHYEAYIVIVIYRHKVTNSLDMSLFYLSYL